MKKLKKEMLMQMVLAFLLGRVIFFDRNPVGIAFYITGYMQGVMTAPVVLMLCLGFLSSLKIELVVRYGAAMMAMAILLDFCKIKQWKLKLWQAAGFITVTLGILSIAQFSILPFTWKDLYSAGSELFLIPIFARIFEDGESFLTQRKKGAWMTQEEFISVLLLMGAAFCGIPSLAFSEISLTAVLVGLCLPIIAYQYGSGIGAIAGAVAGGVLYFLGRDASVMGNFAILGMCTGGMRKQNRIWMIFFYFTTGVLLTLFIEKQGLVSSAVKGFMIDALLLLFLPDRLLRKIHIPILGREGGGEENYFQERMKIQLERVSESFQRLSDVMWGQSEEKCTLGRKETREVIREMSQNVCSQCENRKMCLGQTVMYRTENVQMLAMAQAQGNILPEQMPVEFLKECIHPEWFLAETNRSFQVARKIKEIENKLSQNRRMLAGQMNQVSGLLQEMAEKIEEEDILSENMKENIIREMKKKKINANKIEFYRGSNGHMKLQMNLSAQKGFFVTGKMAARILSSLFGKNIDIHRDCRPVITTQETQMLFEEVSPYYAVTGVARRRKEGEVVSGDNFSCMTLPNGEVLMALSDGMGSGERAQEVSQQVIELLEQMTETGFSEILALQLINALYIPESEEVNFATADVVLIDLFAGNCRFIKNGAAATWLKKKNEMRCIEGRALPIGVTEEAEPFTEKTKISSGDYVIMMTDGVSDAIQRAGKSCKEILEHLQETNPQRMAEKILETALKYTGGISGDDMSVITAGIWKR